MREKTEVKVKAKKKKKRNGRKGRHHVLEENWGSGLHNYELHPDAGLLQSNQTPTLEAESLPVLREEVEEAVHSLKAGKSPGVDNIPLSCSGMEVRQQQQS